MTTILLALAAAGVVYLAGYARGFEVGRKWPLNRLERACPPHCIRRDGTCDWCSTPVAP